MKNKTSIIIKCISLLILALFIEEKSIAQIQSHGNEISLNENEGPFTNGPCISSSEYATIKASIKQFKIILESEGKLDANRTAAVGPHAFIWPLVIDEHYRQFSYFNIGNFVDINPASTGLPGTNPLESLQDYNCGNRTYDDANGYDHSGIDIGIGPFPWKMMDDGIVNVVAVEDGYISSKLDNEWDRNCQTPSPNIYHGNWIVITHSDGTSTLYMHMKSGSVTTKSIGDFVEAGEYLGKIGSSGNSTGPHLHFEVHDNNGNVLDPFQNGSCATGAHPSLWASEKPYYNQEIVSIFTLKSQWTNAACSTNVSPSHAYSETVPYCNHFNPGDTIWFSGAVRDILQNMTVPFRLYSPAGVSLYPFPDHVENNGHVSLRLLGSWYYIAPGTAGTYKIQYTYAGKTRAHYFTVGCPGSVNLSGTRGSNYGYISGGSITSTDVISATAQNVKYQAENTMILSSGFRANKGCQFNAFIDNCTVGGSRPEIISNANENILDFTLTPNPAADEFSITGSQLMEGEDYLVKIFNPVGSEVSSLTLKNFSVPNKIDISGLTNGIYFIQLSFSGSEAISKSAAKKLIVNH